MDTNRQQQRIGILLERLRKRAKLSQAEMAARLGIHVNTVGRHERGEQTVSLLDAIAYADVLGCTLDALAGRATDQLLQIVRPDTVYVIDPKAMATILGAKSISQARKAWVEGYRWDVQVHPEDQVVPRAVWESKGDEIDRHLRELHRKS